MAQKKINYSFANDGLGDPLRQAFIKSDDNFDELYANKVDKVIGKGLSDVNFTQIDKDKLDDLDPNAKVQSDFEENDPLNPAFIENKPTLLSQFDNDLEFVEDVATAGVFGRSAGAWTEIDLSSKENTANKQNSLAVDGTGVKFPTVDAVNAGLSTKISGSGTTNFIPKFTGSGTVGNSSISENSNEIDITKVARQVMTAQASDTNKDGFFSHYTSDFSGYNFHALRYGNGIGGAIGGANESSGDGSGIVGNRRQGGSGHGAEFSRQESGNGFGVKASKMGSGLGSGGGFYNIGTGDGHGVYIENNTTGLGNAINALRNGNGIGVNVAIPDASSYYSSSTSGGNGLLVTRKLFPYYTYLPLVTLASDFNGSFLKIYSRADEFSTSHKITSENPSGQKTFIELKEENKIVLGINTTNVVEVAINGADLKGTPTAPTATAGTNTTQIATTAFVNENTVTLTGFQEITGLKSVRPANNATGFQVVPNAGSGIAFLADLVTNNTSYIGYDVTNNGTGLNYRGQNNGVTTFTVDKFGLVTLVGGTALNNAVPRSQLLYTNQTITANKTVAISEFVNNNELILSVNATSGNITITLPTFTALQGYKVTVKKMDSSANSVLITGVGGVNIDGSASVIISGQYSSSTVGANLSQYIIL